MRLPSLADVEAALCRKSLSHFLRAGWHVLHPGIDLDWSWHLAAICDHVQAVLEELLLARAGAREMRFQNLLVNVPPGSSKTIVAGVYAPAWLWIRDPSLTVRYSSGNPEMVKKSSRASRDLIESDWYRSTFRPAWRIRQDQDAVGVYANDARGARYSRGIDARVTGERVDVLVIDDPIDAADAYSDLARATVNRKWDEAIANRVNDPRRCARVGIMQRLHEGDWSAHVLAQGWRHLCIPMEFEDPSCTCADCHARETVIGWRDPRTERGELMHPSRYPREVVDQEKVVLGSYGAAGQLQQRPAPLEGGIFKRAWWRYVDAPPQCDQVVVSVDANVKKTASGSRTAILVVGRAGASRYVLDAWAQSVDFPDLCPAIRAAVSRWPRVSRVIVEDKANGPAAVATLREELRAAGVVVEAVSPGADSKVGRAQAVSPVVECGQVALLRAPWNEEFVDELATFPNGARDDLVDALSQALIFMRGSHAGAALIAAFGRG